jgi:head-tail adaptor
MVVKPRIVGVLTKGTGDEGIGEMVRKLRRPWAVTVIGADGSKATCAARAWTRLGAEIKAATRVERNRHHCQIEVVRNP